MPFTSSAMNLTYAVTLIILSIVPLVVFGKFGATKTTKVSILIGGTLGVLWDAIAFFPPKIWLVNPTGIIGVYVMGVPVEELTFSYIYVAFVFSIFDLAKRAFP